MSGDKIYKALAAVMAGVGSISKDRNNPQGFKYRGIDDVMNELHGLFASNGVFLLPHCRDHVMTERQTAKGGTIFHHIVSAEFSLTADDGSSVTIFGKGEAADSGDKGLGKAMAYALKVSLLQAFLIPTEGDNDPDAHSPEIRTPAQEFAAAVKHAKAEKEAHWETERKRKDDQAAMFREGPDVFEKLPFNWERDKHLLNAAIRDLNISSSTAKQYRMDLGVVLSREAKNNYEEILKVTKAFFELKGVLDVEA